ncbi:MAG: YhbY family RNA-binding protein [Treponema sp.]|nr:YhbY family RNA-binding protein [Treponema sp.]
MTELSSKQRKILERYAQPLPAAVLIGSAGVTEAQTAHIARCLADHELIKVKFNEFKDDRQTLAEQLAAATDALLVRIIGNVAILYRPAEKPDRRHYEKALAKAQREKNSREAHRPWL